MKNLLFLSVSVGVFLTTFVASADYGRPEPDPANPVCMDEDWRMTLNSSQIVVLKEQSEDQYETRAFVDGFITRIFESSYSHMRFEIKIGTLPTDVVEIVYNRDFGSLPDLELGAHVIVCGDYITARKPSGGYPASPSGAIIHWVHRSNHQRSHEHGFVIIDGVLFGWD